MRSVLTVFLLIVPVAAAGAAGENLDRQGHPGQTRRHQDRRRQAVGNRHARGGRLQGPFDEKDGRLKVQRRCGVVGWFDKDDAVTAEGAVAFFTERIAEDAKDANMHNMRGAAWRLCGEPDKAIKDYSEAIWLIRARRFSAIAAWPGLRRRMPTRRLPTSARPSSSNRTRCIIAPTEPAAIPSRRNTTRPSPTSTSAQAGAEECEPVHQPRHRLCAKKDADKAIGDFSKAIQLEPSVFAHSLCAEMWHFGKRDYDKAIADYNAVLKLDPKNFEAFVDRGSAWLGKKEHDKAIADYSEAIRLEPKNGYAYHLRGGAGRSGRITRKRLPTSTR